MAASPPKDSAYLEEKLDELTKELSQTKSELGEAREQQAATAEILAVISSSRMNLQRVFAEMAASAARLCDAYDAVILQIDGGPLRLVGHHGPIPAPGPLPVAKGTVMGRAVIERQTILVANLQAETEEYPEGSDFALRLGFRTQLAVPLIRAGEAIGVIAIRRREVRPFTGRQIDLLKTFADQAVIAIENTRLFEEVQARTRELTESLEYQTAMSEVLGVISKSPNDVKPVFDTIASSALRLCGAKWSVVTRFDGERMYLAALHNLSDPAGIESIRRIFPRVPTRGGPTDRAIMTGKVVHLPDVLKDPEYIYQAVSSAAGYRSHLAVPMLREGRPLGAITVAGANVGGFSERQVNLLKAFADQAVIAIENARLFEAEQESKRELQEALEQQTATSEVLSVISSSQGELEPVFHAMLENAVRICDAKFGNLWLCEGDSFRLVTAHNAPAAWAERWQHDAVIHPGPGTGLGRVARTRQLVHIADVTKEPAYLERDPLFVAQVELAGGRTLLVVPMLKDDELIGTIGIYRQEVRPFSERQIELLKGFANQAVIAIENTRLLNELRESLQQQTATADVLKVISTSPSDIRPVYESILTSVMRLCEANIASVFLYDGEMLRSVAHKGATPEFAAQLDSSRFPPSRRTSTRRAALERKVIHIHDVRADPEYQPTPAHLDESPRSLLSVPMMRDDVLLGVLTTWRREVKPFSDEQIALVKTFADQAVIAIENTRLFEEVQARTRELSLSLEQQTATSEVLRVISSSPTNVQPVFDAIVRRASSLCGGEHAIVTRYDGTLLHLVAQQNPRSGADEETAKFYPQVPRPGGSISGRALLNREVVHLPDIEVEEFEPSVREAYRRIGLRAALSVPMVHESRPVGVISVSRGSTGPFSDSQIDLLKTFADQAVIAIENATLFEEISQKSRELEIASQHKSQFVANMSHELRTPLAAILGYAELMQEGFYETQGPKSLDVLTRIRSNGKHLLGLINTVLDIAKIESGQFSLNLGEYAIESVVETVRAATESLAETKKLALKTDVAKRLPVGLGDEQRLTQVLLNLVGNALKFTDSGEVRVSATAGNGHFAVSVADTGPGIPLEDQTRIFEQFHQVDSSNTKAKGGTGLGLAIAKQIVEMHGGRIWVESTVGKGSTFQMELPVRAEFRKSAL